MSLPTPHRHTLHSTLAPMFGFLAAGSVAPTAWADTPAATANDSVVSLPQIKVDGEEATSSFKVDRVTSAKISQPLLDAPQSVTIVPQQVLKEQNAQTLQEVLRNVRQQIRRRFEQQQQLRQRAVRGQRDLRARPRKSPRLLAE